LTEPRLKSRFRVQAALREAQGRGSFGAVVRPGDDDAGGIILLLRARDGLITILGEARTQDGAPAWVRTAGGQPVDPMAAEAYTAREIARDPDLWVVEFDAENGRPPFEATLLPPRHGG
jgi:hypothetical protein